MELKEMDSSSPKIVEMFVNEIVKNKNYLPKIFRPTRKLISYYDKNIAIEKAFNSTFNKQNSHGMKLTDHNYYDEYRLENLKKINSIYDKHKISKFGIHPELLDLYNSNKIKNKDLYLNFFKIFFKSKNASMNCLVLT